MVRYKGFILSSTATGKIELRTNVWSSKMFATFENIEQAKAWIDSLSSQQLDFFLGPEYSRFLREPRES